MSTPRKLHHDPRVLEILYRIESWLSYAGTPGAADMVGPEIVHARRGSLEIFVGSYGFIMIFWVNSNDLTRNHWLVQFIRENIPKMVLIHLNSGW